MNPVKTTTGLNLLFDPDREAADYLKAMGGKVARELDDADYPGWEARRFVRRDAEYWEGQQEPVVLVPPSKLGLSILGAMLLFGALPGLFFLFIVVVSIFSLF